MKKETSDVELYDFYIKLCQHDWYYEYSEDYYKWTKGKEDYSLLKSFSERNEEHQELWNAYNEYISLRFDKNPPKKPEIIYRDAP